MTERNKQLGTSDPICVVRDAATNKEITFDAIMHEIAALGRRRDRMSRLRRMSSTRSLRVEIANVGNEWP